MYYRSSISKFLASVIFLTSLAVVYFSGSFFSAEAQNMTEGCEYFSVENSSSGDFYQGYGVPWNVFSPDKPLSLRVGCMQDSITFKLGNNNKNQYIWNTAYISRNGGAWEALSLEGGQATGGWYRAGAFTTIDANTSGNASNFLLAYICTNVDGEWKCGCRDAETCDGDGAWQLQEVKPQERRAGGLGAGSPTALLGDVDFTSPTIFYPADYEIGKGSNMIIRGGGFEPGQNVFFEGYGAVPANVNETGTAISLRVPDDISYGRYDIYVQDEKENSNTSFVVVKDPRKLSPSVETVRPQAISPGETMTIRGSGFTANGNEIRTNFGVVSGEASSDGRTLKFTFPNIESNVNGSRVESLLRRQGLSEDGFQDLQTSGKQFRGKKQMPGVLHLVNDNGVAESVRFTIEY